MTRPYRQIPSFRLSFSPYPSISPLLPPSFSSLHSLLPTPFFFSSLPLSSPPQIQLGVWIKLVNCLLVPQRAFVRNPLCCSRLSRLLWASLVLTIWTFWNRRWRNSIKLSAQLKWNWNKTVSKQFQNCFKTLLFQFHFNCADSLSRSVRPTDSSA